MSMLEKVISIGRRRVENYRVRNLLQETVEDAAVLGSLLWQAFEGGEVFVVTNPLLWPMLGKADPAPDIDALMRWLAHADRPLFYNPEWTRTPEHPNEIFWNDTTHELMSGVNARPELARELADRLDEIDNEAERRIVAVHLALGGHLEAAALHEGALGQVAASWLSSINQRLHVIHYKSHGGEGVWGADAWWDALLEQSADPGLKSLRPSGTEFAPIYQRFTAQQALDFAARIKPEDLNPYEIERLTRQSAPELEAVVTAELESMLSDPAGADIGRLTVCLGCHLVLCHDRQEPSEARFDPLLHRVLNEVLTNMPSGKIPHGSPYREMGAFKKEWVTSLPVERLEPIALLQVTPWTLGTHCPTPTVAKRLVESIAASTGRLDWDQGHSVRRVLNGLSGAAVPHVIKALGRKFTQRKAVIIWLGEAQDPRTLPALVNLLGADADTRKLVSKVLDAWGSQEVVPALEPALANQAKKAKKMRTAAAALLVRMSDHPEAARIAAQTCDIEQEPAIKASLAGLAARYVPPNADGQASQAPEHAGPTRMPARSRLQLYALLEGYDATAEQIAAFGPGLVDEAVIWVRDKEAIGSAMQYWSGHLKYSQYTQAHNLQRLGFEWIKARLDTAPTEEARAAVHDAVLEEGGWRALEPLGQAGLAALVEDLWPVGRVSEDLNWKLQLNGILGYHAGDTVKSALSILDYVGSDYSNRLENVKAARELVENVVRSPLQRAERLEEALELVEVHRQDNHDEVVAGLAAVLAGEKRLWDLKEAHGQAILPALLEWLIAQHEAGVFEQGWIAVSMSYQGWRNLLELAKALLPHEVATDEVVNAVADACKTDAGRLAVMKTHDAMVLDAVSHALPPLKEVGKVIKFRPINPGTVSWHAVNIILEAMQGFQGEVPLHDALESLLMIFNGRRNSASEIEKTLKTLSIVLDRGELEPEAQKALVERLILGIGHDDESSRNALLSWLYQRLKDGAPEAQMALEALLGALAERRKKVRESASRLVGWMGPSILPRIWEMVADKKITVRREAATLLQKIPHPDSLPHINKALAKEKKADIKDALGIAILNCSPLPDLEGLDDTAVDQALVERAEKLSNKSSIVKDNQLPALRWASGADLSEVAMVWMMTQLIRVTAVDVPYGLKEVIERLDAGSRNAFWDALDKATRDKGVVEQRPWVDHALRLLLTEAHVEGLAARFDKLTRGFKGRGYRLAMSMARRNSDEAARALSVVAQSARKVEDKRAASRALSQMASQRKLTAAELTESVTADFGFGVDGRLEVDLDGQGIMGAWVLGPDLRLNVQAPDGSTHSSPVEAAKAAGVALHDSVKARFESLYDALDQVMEVQRGRFEGAMLAAERWQAARWRALYTQHPVLRAAAQGVVFEAHGEGSQGYFAVLLDGTLVNADGSAFELSDGAEVAVPHPVDMDAAQMDAWRACLQKASLAQPIEQLERPVYAVEGLKDGFKAFLEPLGHFEAPRDLRRAMKAMGLSQQHVEALVYEGAGQIGGHRVLVSHDAYSINFMEMRESLLIKSVELSEGAPARVYSEMASMLMKHVPARHTT